MANNTSHHILNTAANLLGFCLIVITSLHIGNKSENTLIDEFTSIIAISLTVSCLFSFISLRTQNERREQKLEKTAEYFFIASLIGIFLVIAFMATAVFNHNNHNF